mgnify:CR=1 FL=1
MVRGKKRADADRLKLALDFAISEAEETGGQVTLSLPYARLLRCELEYLPKPKGGQLPSMDEMSLRRWVRNRYEQMMAAGVDQNTAFETLRNELKAEDQRNMTEENIRKWVYYTEHH